MEVVLSENNTNGDAEYANTQYDSKVEEQEYARSLLSLKELSQIKEQKIMTIDGVRELVRQNSVKSSIESSDVLTIDPEIMLLIDVQTNYRIFMTKDNIYTREELLQHFPFEQLDVTPESVFAQQEVGVFSDSPDSPNEFVTRDIGSDTELVMVEDVIKKACGKINNKRIPTRIVKTKIYLGKEKWDDFCTIRKFARCFQTFIAPMASQQSLTWMFGSSAGLLAIGAGDRDIDHKHQELQIREDRVKLNEERLKLDSEIKKVREERSKLEEEHKQLDIDLANLDKMTK